MLNPNLRDKQVLVTDAYTYWEQDGFQTQTAFSILASLILHSLVPLTLTINREFWVAHTDCSMSSTSENICS